MRKQGKKGDAVCVALSVMSFPRCGRALRRQAVRTAEDEHRFLDRQAEQQHGQRHKQG